MVDVLIMLVARVNNVFLHNTTSVMRLFVFSGVAKIVRYRNDTLQGNAIFRSE